VKFIFPNNFNIYFHDTPAKSLFSNRNRAFSHGCIRVEEPVKLANYLLRDQSQWTDEAVYKAMHSEKEKWVKLKEPLPVRITYFTAWVDGNGVLNYRDDIYGHDAIMKKRLFEHSSSH
jgi:murein L,D-transpeptidase YcbB/YkuD